MSFGCLLSEWISAVFHGTGGTDVRFIPSRSQKHTYPMASEGLSCVPSVVDLEFHPTVRVKNTLVYKLLYKYELRQAA